MCLISVLPKGTLKTGEKVEAFIRSGADANGMGSGYAHKRNGEKTIYLSKAFWNVEYLIQAINESKLTEDDELIIHHRIATSGTDANLNTHPFIVTHDFEEMTKLTAVTDKPVMAHNGIFYNFNDIIDKTYNDTAHWIHLIMSNPHYIKRLKDNPDLFLKEYGKALSINSTKLVFLFPDRDLVMINDFIKDEGYFHSNGGYKDWRVRNIGGNEQCSVDNAYSRNTKYFGNFPKALNAPKNQAKIIKLDPEADPYLKSEDCYDTVGIKKVTLTVGDKVPEKKSVYFVNDLFIDLNINTIKYFNIKKKSGSGDFYYVEKENFINSLTVCLTKLGDKTKQEIVTWSTLLKWNNRIVRKEYISLFLDIYQLKLYVGLTLNKSTKKKLTSWYNVSVRKNRTMTLINKKKEKGLLVRTEALGLYLDEFEKGRSKTIAQLKLQVN